MTNELKVAYCPACGKIYQKNMRNLCMNCQSEEDTHIRALEKTLMRNRQLNNEQLVAATDVPQEKLLSWIRTGKLKLYDYPNLSDQCDVCKGPIRRGKLCLKCSTKIQDDIAHELQQERLMKERLRASIFLAKQ
jgi:hypothetical protein